LHKGPCQLVSAHQPPIHHRSRRSDASYGSVAPCGAKHRRDDPAGQSNPACARHRGSHPFGLAAGQGDLSLKGLPKPNINRYFIFDHDPYALTNLLNFEHIITKMKLILSGRFE